MQSTRSRYLNETTTRPAMPKDWKSPLRAPLYQVVVEPTDGSPAHFYGPAWTKESAEKLCQALKDAIKVTSHPTIANPTVMRVNSFPANA